jgi:hypothetical protein
MSFHLPMSSFISSVSDSWFLLHRPFTFLVKFIPSYVIFLCCCIIVFLMSFSGCLLLVYRNATDICILILYTDTMLNICMRSNGFWWSFYCLSGVISRLHHQQTRMALLLPFIFESLLFLSPVLLLWPWVPVLFWTMIGRV